MIGLGPSLQNLSAIQKEASAVVAGKATIDGSRQRWTPTRLPETSSREDYSSGVACWPDGVHAQHSRDRC